jgi:hypothetical protein
MRTAASRLDARHSDIDRARGRVGGGRRPPHLASYFIGSGVPFLLDLWFLPGAADRAERVVELDGTGELPEFTGVSL